MTDGDPTADDSDEGSDGNASSLPGDVVDRAESLTRRARETADDGEAAAYRRARDELLAEHGYDARVRADDDGDVLVCYPSEWVTDGVVDVEGIEDVDRGIERQLSGPGEAAEWAAVDEHNRAVAAAVAERHGPVHGDNADAFATFMSNHYAKPIERATAEERAEFLAEYFPRNAWPSEKQREIVEESVTRCVELAEDLSDGPRR